MLIEPCHFLAYNIGLQLIEGETLSWRSQIQHLILYHHRDVYRREWKSLYVYTMCIHNSQISIDSASTCVGDDCKLYCLRIVTPFHSLHPRFIVFQSSNPLIYTMGPIRCLCPNMMKEGKVQEN